MEELLPGKCEALALLPHMEKRVSGEKRCGKDCVPEGGIKGGGTKEDRRSWQRLSEIATLFSDFDHFLLTGSLASSRSQA